MLGLAENFIEIMSLSPMILLLLHTTGLLFLDVSETQHPDFDCWLDTYVLIEFLWFMNSSCLELEYTRMEGLSEIVF